MENFWDTRFKQDAYVYGTLPNAFFKDTMDRYKPIGNLLLPAEGEGRNAVYAAKEGLNVYAFDTSIEGKNKAIKLAERNHITINYEVGDFFKLKLIAMTFDAAALIFAHFTTDIVSDYHKKISDLLKPNGLLILEGFSKNHIEFQKVNPNAGGPKNVEMLFSKETITRDFPNFEVLKLEEVEDTLNEGEFHKGKAKLIRFIGRKVV
ncbi:MAG: class I SAM-dependent methyltransferase [Flavobacteriales bacterium]|nr:class I SAM-dependent methyltransferase [Flavobacteriia bacterium]NCP05518.1 class I SAM-dependent methyltransferase [Flavobacteriales bacterium]PIV92390.1 MAG: SAM-dependent methyltransferase [Flavobacteriaceae bacterium CG17_big_fil_post_rev_8_21_14_2_50_33_15]PIY11788.1 MAG: SAM-dependent methyltransferase [Flavobacteriaceae bacterium CG_4_10_14_3_um_filter_33_47]PJB16767.1 MAG: SAM-dependent methyltransferase [Flavobacteriaceae bacterium CG_4_9_14_3_um_filter_33_16]